MVLLVSYAADVCYRSQGLEFLKTSQFFWNNILCLVTT